VRGLVWIITVWIKTVLIDVTDQSALSSIVPPPSTVLKEFSKAPRHQVTGDLLEKAAKKALLSTDDAHIWLEHLQTVLKDRKQGAANAAATRRARKAVQSTTVENSDNHCGKCGKEFTTITDEYELGVGCDLSKGTVASVNI